MPLTLLTPAVTPRLRYTCGVVSDLLGFPLEPRAVGQGEISGPFLVYSQSGLAEGPRLHCDGLLLQSGVDPDYRPDPGRDWLAAIFYLLSDYEKYQAEHLDAHGRYDPAVYPSAQWGLDRQPQVQVWAQSLGYRIRRLYPRLPLSPPPFRVSYTVDVDHPWRYRYKGPLATYGGMARALWQRHWGEFRRRWRTWLGGPDPNFTFPTLYRLLPPAQTVFFCLLDRNSPHDSRFTYRHPQWRRLMQEFQRRGYRVGIHPSYTSYRDGYRIGWETQHLSQVIGQPVRHSRQHFLRFRLPDTYRHLLAAGIRHDYTPCLYPSGGFPHGMAQPFFWYDLLAEQQTELLLHPTQVMDRSLQYYRGMAPQQALAHLEQLLATTRRYGGTFTLLLHNDSLSETDEWRGWSQAIQAMVAAMQR